MQRRKGAANRIPAIFAHIGLWLTAFALLAQSIAAAAPPMDHLGTPREVAAELSSILGGAVVVCVNDDPSAPPGSPYDHCDQCPLCQLAAHALALDVPTATSFETPIFKLAAHLSAISPASQTPRRLLGFALARGPPSLT